MLDNLNQYNNQDIAKEGVSTYSYESVGKQFLEIYSQLIKN